MSESLTMGEITVCLEDMIRWGFLKESLNEKGEQVYSLTELGKNYKLME